MQDKQKVTLYLAPEVHRQLKIKAAIDADSMSAMVERAISFYLQHPEKVEEVEAAASNNYQVHVCPECNNPMVLQEGRMVSLKNQPSVIEEELSLGVKVESPATAQGEQLVPC